MISITKPRVGRCSGCDERPAEYSIAGDFNSAEWEGAKRVCQECMLNIMQESEKLRLILTLQAATNEAR